MSTQKDEAWRETALAPLGRDALVAKLIQELQGQKVILDLAPGATYQDEVGVGLVSCMLSSAPPTVDKGRAWGGFPIGQVPGKEWAGKLYCSVAISKVRAVLPYGSPEAEALREVAS